MSAIPEISIDELIERYTVLLLDIYGVLADATGALPGAIALIDKLNRSNKPYYLLTNDASKLPATAARRYRSFGLAIAENCIISAGSLLTGHFRRHGLTGKDCIVLGPEDSRRHVELAGGVVVTPKDHFEVLVIGDQSGFPFLQTMDDVLSAIFARLDQGERVSLILPNPDLIYPKRNGGFGFASGSVATIMEAALALRYPGRHDLCFARLGKPHTALFAEAKRRCNNHDMVMIGDQLETDIRGANAFGIDSALLAGGVTGPLLADRPDSPRSTYYLKSLE